MSPEAFPLSRVDWRPGYRLIPSRFPPRGLFDRVADPADLEDVIQVESLTNDRLRDEVGDITLVPRDERMVGPGSTPVMAAFTHVNPRGSRFADATYGVFYAGASLATAVRETVYHRERFLKDSGYPALTIEMREYRADVSGLFRDLRGAGTGAALLDPGSYTASQPFGTAERQTGGDGIVYPSVRDPGGECVAVFRPRALSPARQGGHYGYLWDGNAISHIVKLSDPKIRPHP